MQASKYMMILLITQLQLNFLLMPLEVKFPSKKILGLVELGSNTMSGGSHGLSLVDSARSLDHVIWLDHQNVLSEKKEISTSKNIDDFVESAKIAAQDYDVILLMTNRDSSKILNPITTYLEKK